MYGTALGNKDYIIEAADASSTNVTDYTFYTAQPKAGNTANAVKEVDEAETVAAKIDLLKQADLPAGMVASHYDNDTLRINGTPLQRVDDPTVWYLVVQDNSQDGPDSDYSTADPVVTKITIDVAQATAAVAAAPTARLVGSTVSFGAGSTNKAKAGYTVKKVKDSGSTKDNVVPVELTVTETITEAQSDKVTATIKAFSEVNTNTNEEIVYGNESKNAFTVTPAQSENILSTGVPAKFTVAPSTGLQAKDAAGTTYKAKLVLSSKTFKDKEFTLQFTVTSDLEISSVVAHGGTTVTIDNPTDAYDLGEIMIGEDISDIVITGASNSGGKITYTAKTTSTENGHALSALPDGLSFDTKTDNVCKVKGIATATAKNEGYINDSVSGYKEFALVANDSVSGAEKTVYFKYKVKQPDIHIGLVKGPYNEDTEIYETEIEAGKTKAFSWAGASTSLAADEYATVYIENNSKVDLTFVPTLVNNDGTDKGSFTLDPATVATTGIKVEAEKSASFKIIPGTVDDGTNTDKKTMTLKAVGVLLTTANLTYTEHNSEAITKPATSGQDMPDIAYVGDWFQYSFEAAYTTDHTGVAWEITQVEEYDTGNTIWKPVATTDSLDYLDEKYGLYFNNNTLSGILEKTAPSDNNSGNRLKLTVQATFTRADGGAADVLTTTAYLNTAKPAGIELRANGSKIDITNGAAAHTMRKVTLDSLEKATTTFTLTNKTVSEQEKVRATIFSVDGSETEGDKAKAVLH